MRLPISTLILIKPHIALDEHLGTKQTNEPPVVSELLLQKKTTKRMCQKALSHSPLRQSQNFLPNPAAWIDKRCYPPPSCLLVLTISAIDPNGIFYQLFAIGGRGSFWGGSDSADDGGAADLRFWGAAEGAGEGFGGES